VTEYPYVLFSHLFGGLVTGHLVSYGVNLASSCIPAHSAGDLCNT